MIKKIFKFIQRELFVGKKMDPKFTYLLELPCQERGIEFTDNKNGTVTLDDQIFNDIKKIEKYLYSKPRIKNEQGSSRSN